METKKIYSLSNNIDHYRFIGKACADLEPLHVSYLSNEDKAIAVIDGEQKFIKIGMYIGADAIINSRDSVVVLDDYHGNRIKLLPNSEFTITNSVLGYRPISYGHVHIDYHGENQILSHHKYVTTCWVDSRYRDFSCSISRLSATQDIYYTYASPITIFELDEQGQRFDIVDVEPYQRCILSFTENVNMRSRYHVSQLESYDEVTISKLFQRYLVHGTDLAKITAKAQCGGETYG